MSKKEIIKFLILRSIGNFLLLFALYGVGATFGPTLFYEAEFRIAQARGVKFTIAQAQQIPPVDQPVEKKPEKKSPFSDFAQILAGEKEQILMPKDINFTLLIPKIGANEKIFSNVDANNKDEFLPLLQQGIAHAKGTVFPGMKGNIYLFAHSTDNFWDVGRYNAIFYLLKDLGQGDEIVVFFEGLRHNYVVERTETIDPDNVSYIVSSQEVGKEQLILQTCWPPGTAWKRLLVIARAK